MLVGFAGIGFVANVSAEKGRRSSRLIAIDRSCYTKG
jgi:hypothetical protein